MTGIFVGKNFGDWVVAEEPKTVDKRSITVCKCSCGKTSPVRTEHLKSGRSTNCGCIRKKRLLQANRGRPFGALYTSFLHSAASYEMPINLSYEEFVFFTKDVECHYCGEPIKWPEYAPQRTTGVKRYNLDRKDNSKGYSLENCVVCCKTCNYAKADRYSYEEWKCMTAALKRFRG